MGGARAVFQHPIDRGARLRDARLPQRFEKADEDDRRDGGGERRLWLRLCISDDELGEGGDGVGVASAGRRRRETRVSRRYSRHRRDHVNYKLLRRFPDVLFPVVAQDPRETK